VPFLMSWPGVLPAGVTYDAPITALDVLPTAVSLAGLQLPADLDGLDLMPHLLGERTEAPHDTLHWRVCGGEGWAVRRGRWKLVRDVSMEAPALYDLEQDLGEDRDLAAEKPVLVAELEALHAAWDAGLVAPRWSDGHRRSVSMERDKASEAGQRQFPMVWDEDPESRR